MWEFAGAAVLILVTFRVIQKIVAEWQKDPRDAAIRTALLKRLDELVEQDRLSSAGPTDVSGPAVLEHRVPNGGASAHEERSRCEMAEPGRSKASAAEVEL